MKYKTDIEFPNEVSQMKKSTSHHLEIVRKGFLCCPSSKSWYFLCLNGKLEIITYRGSILLKKKNGTIIKMKTLKQIFSFQVGDKALAAVVL